MSLWRNEFIPVNEFTRPGIKRNHTRNLVWHYTANPGASAANHYRYFANLRDRYASAHIFIDKNEAICIIPLDELAYHAGPANPYSIGIELCIEQDGSFHPDTIAQAVAIGKELNRMYGLTVSDQMRHFDITGKICPKPWVDDVGAWTRFRDQLVEKKKEAVMLDKGVAETMISSFLSPSWMDAHEAMTTAEKEGRTEDAKAWLKQRDYYHWLANELRKAAGLPL